MVAVSNIRLSRYHVYVKRFFSWILKVSFFKVQSQTVDLLAIWLNVICATGITETFGDGIRFESVGISKLTFHFNNNSKQDHSDHVPCLLATLRARNGHLQQRAFELNQYSLPVSRSAGNIRTLHRGWSSWSLSYDTSQVKDYRNDPWKYDLGVRECGDRTPFTQKFISLRVVWWWQSQTSDFPDTMCM